MLRLLGYRSVDHAEYLKTRLGLPASLPAKPVLITFDDAFESALTSALPVLKERFKPTPETLPARLSRPRLDRPPAATSSHLPAP